MPGLQLGAASAAPRCAGLRSGNIPDVRSFIARQQQDSLPHFFNPNLSVRSFTFRFRGVDSAELAALVEPFEHPQGGP